jgi:outer membrane protein assembly factor BamD (BamD/ComL family)
MNTTLFVNATTIFAIVDKFLAASIIMVIFVAISGCGAEEKSWEQVEKLDSIAAYRQFIEKYPDGIYADKAQLKIEELDFKKAETRNTVQAYIRYLEKYPNGAYTEKVQLNIEIITISSNNITIDVTK